MAFFAGTYKPQVKTYSDGYTTINSDAILIVTSFNGATINWYASLTGTSIGTGNTYVVQNVTSSSYYYADVTYEGRTTDQRILVKADILSEIGAYRHSLLINKSSGQVWSWGMSDYGELGTNNGSIFQALTPASILGTKKTFRVISAGHNSSLGIDKNGQVWCWGFNMYGLLGDNTQTDKSTPVSILGNKKTFCKIVGSRRHSVGIDKNGQIWCWGNNWYGEIGNNSRRTMELTPVSIHGAKKTFCQIVVGSYDFWDYAHTIGLDKNGQVWCWGFNMYGLLGDNTQTDKSTPVSILGAKKTFCKIATGTSHSLGIDKNGQVWGWGYNLSGIGDDTLIQRLTPVSIHGAKKTFCQITIGSEINNWNSHSLGIDKNGQIWSWGRNNRGQLGDNTVEQRLTPVSILGAKKTFCKIISGEDHVLAIDKYCQVWSWGKNDYGELGDNTQTERCTPVRVCGF